MYNPSTIKYTYIMRAAGKIAFKTSKTKYCYNVILFRLKNASMTYKKVMNKIFKMQIGDMLYV